MFKYLIFFPFFLLNLNATQLIFEDIKEYKITTKKVDYIIEAKLKKIDLDKLKKFKFFNKKNIISNSSYYENGHLQKDSFFINFKKGYFLEGNFIMENISAINGTQKIVGEKAILKKDEVSFNKVFVYDNNKRVRKIKLSYPID